MLHLYFAKAPLDGALPSLPKPAKQSTPSFHGLAHVCDKLGHSHEVEVYYSFRTYSSALKKQHSQNPLLENDRLLGRKFLEIRGHL